MLNFKKIRRKDGSFLAYDIRLDRAETIKVIGKDGTVKRLWFSVPGDEARISDQWRRGES